MAKILLKQTLVLNNSAEAESVDIAIDNDKIYQVGKIDESWKPDQIIDCTDKIALPGFVNTHTHAAMTLLRSYADDMKLMDWLGNKIWPIEAKMKRKDIYWGSMLAITEMIKTGTTTFADMYADMEQVAEAVAETGIRAVLSRGIIGINPNGETALGENIALFNNYNNTADGRITVMFGPHAPYTCPPDFLKKVIAAAKECQAEVHMHLSETAGEVADCFKQYGKSPIALMEETGLFECGVLAAHCVHVSAEDIAIMKKHNVRVAHNPISNMKLASGIAPVQQMLEQGICVGLGTDGTSSNNNLDMMEELRIVALLHKVNAMDPLVIPAKTAIELATTCGAQAVGLKDELGVISPGYKADIILLSMNDTRWYPRHNTASLVAYSANSSAVDTVIVNGKILLKDGKLTSIDEERVIYEANQCAKNLTSIS